MDLACSRRYHSRDYWSPCRRERSALCKQFALKKERESFGLLYPVSMVNVQWHTQIKGCAYALVFPSKRHQAVGKETGKTSYIERFNCTMRISSLTISSSNSLLLQKTRKPYRCHLAFCSPLQLTEPCSINGSNKTASWRSPTLTKKVIGRPLPSQRK